MNEDRPIRTLVVDDEAAVRTLHSRFVSGAPGFELVGAVESGEMAIAHALHGGVDLILLDMQLPGISGVEVLHRLHREIAHPPSVLVISSARDYVTVRQALSARIVGYLVKPFTQTTLHERLRAVRAGFRGLPVNEQDRPLAQSEIDRMLNPARRAIPAGVAGVAGAVGAASPEPTGSAIVPTPTLTSLRLPKGLATTTLERVVDELDPGQSLSVAEVAARCEISKPTARRYLEFLVLTGFADVAHRYGHRGRPEVLYRLSASR
jgi:response regulator of citrate/malate metabolism